MKPCLRLFCCGAAILFWELVLIRWLGTSVRIVAYYSNLVLMAAFSGLGAGALLNRYARRLYRLAPPAVMLCIVIGLAVGRLFEDPVITSDEYVWFGPAFGVIPDQLRGVQFVPRQVLLFLIYVLVWGVFALLGEWVARLFRAYAALRAYSLEIAGSVTGIGLFCLSSWLELPPTCWFGIGFLLLLATLGGDEKWVVALAVASAVVSIAVTRYLSTDLIWSPYYRIEMKPVSEVLSPDRQARHRFDPPVGHVLTVNNDYHQMMLDLALPRAGVAAPEHPFVTEWRRIYDLPYDGEADLPPGPILIIGAGTGNDVSAALRQTQRQVVAVEIDPAIARLGRDLHAEKPYQDPRVTLILNDARSFLQSTSMRFALVVFGFLDSHTLLSTLPGVRLDNFVYTEESFSRVRDLLVAGGRVAVTFATRRPWIDERMRGLLTQAFGTEPVVHRGIGTYPNGVVYINHKDHLPRAATDPQTARLLLPTDDWPFFYLRTASIPSHYLSFMIFALLMGTLALGLLPKGRRQLRLPLFFMGAAFFLLETSNVVSLSILFGSTWYVNASIFATVLFLILGANLVTTRLTLPRPDPIFLCLLASIVLAYALPTQSFLRIDNMAVRGLAAGLVFLSPVFFAGLIFALLIKDEPDLYQAYGSNLLGAVIGGVLEYLSLLAGFKFLLVVTSLLYLATYFSLHALRRSAVR